MSVTPTLPDPQTPKLSFTYDSKGRRVRKQTHAWDTDHWELSEDRLFLYDGWNLVAEITVSGTTHTLRSTHLWGLDLSGSLQGAGGVGGLLRSTLLSTSTPQPPPSPHFPVYDGNGNIVRYLSHDATSLATSATLEYTPFGRTLQSTGSALSELPFGFSSKYLDSVPQLYYYGHRYYSPVSGRWLTTDPFAELGGPNLYTFTANDPISLFDLLGLLTQSNAKKIITQYLNLKASSADEWDESGGDLSDMYITNLLGRLNSGFGPIRTYQFGRSLIVKGLGGLPGGGVARAIAIDVLEQALNELYNEDKITPAKLAEKLIEKGIKLLPDQAQRVATMILKMGKNVGAKELWGGLRIVNVKTDSGPVINCVFVVAARTVPTYFWQPEDYSDFRISGECTFCCSENVDRYGGKRRGRFSVNVKGKKATVAGDYPTILPPELLKFGRN